MKSEKLDVVIPFPSREEEEKRTNVTCLNKSSPELPSAQDSHFPYSFIIFVIPCPKTNLIKLSGLFLHKSNALIEIWCCPVSSTPFIFEYFGGKNE